MQLLFVRWWHKKKKSVYIFVSAKPAKVKMQRLKMKYFFRQIKSTFKMQ